MVRGQRLARGALPPVKGSSTPIRSGLRNPCGRYAREFKRPQVHRYAAGRRWRPITHVCLACANGTGHIWELNPFVLIGARCSASTPIGGCDGRLGGPLGSEPPLGWPERELAFALASPLRGGDKL